MVSLRHAGRQILGTLPLQQQMEVVAQETIMVELEGEAMAIAVQEVQKVPAVLGVGEYGLSVVTAVHDVVASAGPC